MFIENFYSIFDAEQDSTTLKMGLALSVTNQGATIGNVDPIAGSWTDEITHLKFKYGAILIILVIFLLCCATCGLNRRRKRFLKRQAEEELRKR